MVWNWFGIGYWKTDSTHATTKSWTDSALICRIALESVLNHLRTWAHSILFHITYYILHTTFNIVSHYILHTTYYILHSTFYILQHYILHTTYYITGALKKKELNQMWSWCWWLLRIRIFIHSLVNNNSSIWGIFLSLNDWSQIQEMIIQEMM